MIASITVQEAKLKSLLNDYFDDPYKIVSVVKEKSFHQYVIRIDDIEHKVIVDLDDMVVREYQLIDDNFRQCLDNE